MRRAGVPHMAAACYRPLCCRPQHGLDLQLHGTPPGRVPAQALLGHSRPATTSGRRAHPALYAMHAPALVSVTASVGGGRGGAHLLRSKLPLQRRDAVPQALNLALCALLRLLRGCDACALLPPCCRGTAHACIPGRSDSRSRKHAPPACSHACAAGRPRRAAMQAPPPSCCQVLAAVSAQQDGARLAASHAALPAVPEHPTSQPPPGPHARAASEPPGPARAPCTGGSPPAWRAAWR